MGTEFILNEKKELFDSTKNEVNQINDIIITIPSINLKDGHEPVKKKFEIGDSSPDNDESTTSGDEISTNNQKESTKPSVRFPKELEKHFYQAYPKPPVEEEEAEKSPTRKEKILHYLHEKFPSRIVRRVLKCTIAYFLTALFSLIHPISSALGAAPFLTTTGMLFSHPGRSMGAQFDATVTAIMGVVAAVLYTFAGMAASVSYTQHHPNSLDGRIINAVFLFFGIFFSQLLRQRFPKFHFFSLQFMIIQIFCMTRAIDYVYIPFHLPLTYGVPLIIGHGISLAVNLIFWPETAVDGLGRALKETFGCSRDMLNLITKQFFLLESEPVSESIVDSTAENMRKGMTKVKAAYHEAKYEISYAFIRPQQLGQIRKSLGRLTKHLFILGSCLKTERELFESAIDALRSEMDTDSDDNTVDHDIHRSYSEEDLNLLRSALRATNDYIKKHSNNTTPLSSKTNSRANSTYNSEDEDEIERKQQNRRSFLSLPKLSAPKPKPPKKSKKQTEYHHRHLLLTYLESLRDPLMELSLDCTNVLECLCDSLDSEMNQDDDTVRKESWISFLKHTFGKPTIRKNLHDGGTCNCSQNIRLSIIRFDQSEKERMKKLDQINQSRSDALDLGMRQELFLVFFFIFTMRQVANELQEMTLQMDELRLESRKSSFMGKKKKRFYVPGMNLKMWQKWAEGNNHQNTRDKGGDTFAALTIHIPRAKERDSVQQNEQDLIRTISKRRESNNEEAITLPNLRRRRRGVCPEQVADIKPPSFTNEAAKLPLLLKIRYYIWLRFQYFEKYEFKFALKLAVAVLVLCIPAFTPNSVAWYTSVRGQWAALTVITVMNPTSGGTLEFSFWRIVGTLVGAFVGWAALAAGNGSPYLLGIFAVLLALPFFYIHLTSTYNKVCIVTLTTYMVVALSRYANPTPGETIEATVWKRTITLIVGICVALLLNSLIWPFIAQHMIGKSIAGCINQLEDYYIYVMGTYLYQEPSDTDITKGEKMENKIQSAIDACQVLLDITDHEPRFRGPFPSLFYKEMILSMRNILDHMLSIRIALIQMPTAVKYDICDKAYHKERREMIASMILTFHTLAASLRSKTHLPVYLPSTRAARFKLIQHRQSIQKTNWIKFRNLTWFAMACSSEEIIEELEHFSNLVGYVVGENEFASVTKKIDAITCLDTQMPCLYTFSGN